MKKRLNILLLERSSRFAIDLVSFLSMQHDVEHVLYASDFAQGYQYLKELSFHIVFVGIPLSVTELDDLIALGRTRVHCTFIKLSEPDTRPHLGISDLPGISYSLEKNTCRFIIPEILETEARSYFTQPPSIAG